ncbi:MAG: DUF1844 domain-containing protein [Thermoguttaceae bacterium]|jgi:hypothetical protein
MSDETKAPAEKKIIVDEDWKSQVEAEKEAGRRTETPPAEPPQEAEPDVPLPPASLTYLAGTLYLQGAVALGLLPNPVSKKAEVRLPLARHAIDTLAVLEEKTEGHRSLEETEEIEAMLHQLRMAFVEVQRQTEERS